MIVRTWPLLVETLIMSLCFRRVHYANEPLLWRPVLHRVFPRFYFIFLKIFLFFSIFLLFYYFLLFYCFFYYFFYCLLFFKIIILLLFFLLFKLFLFWCASTAHLRKGAV